MTADERTGRVIDRDVACASCGYNLRGLAPDGRCPECGAPIANSLRGNTLSSCDPRWLGRLRLGADLIRVGMIVSVGLVLAVVITSGMPPLRAWILLAFHVIATGLMIAGTWLLTQPEIREEAKSSGAKARRRCRTVVLLILLEDGYLITAVLINPVGVLTALIIRTLTALGWLGLVTAYIRGLSGRTDSQRLRDTCSNNGVAVKLAGAAMGLLALTMLVGFLLATFVDVRPDVLEELIRPVLMIEAIVLPLFLLCSFVFTWLMLGAFGMAIHRASVAGRRRWSPQDGCREEPADADSGSVQERS